MPPTGAPANTPSPAPLGWPAGLPTIKSSYSTDDKGNCVELGIATTTVGVRDSKLGAASPILELDKPTFQAFLDAAKASRLDRPVQRDPRGFLASQIKAL